MAEQPKDSRKQESLDNDIIAGDDDLVGRDIAETEGGGDGGPQKRKEQHDGEDPAG